MYFFFQPLGSCPYLKSSIGDELDCEVEHEAVGVLLGQLVNERAPRGVFNHLRQPGRRFTLIVEDGVRLLGVKVLQDHLLQVVFYQALNLYQEG